VPANAKGDYLLSVSFDSGPLAGIQTVKQILKLQ
jgi:hypothetical protein